MRIEMTEELQAALKERAEAAGQRVNDAAGAWRDGWWWWWWWWWRAGKDGGWTEG